MKGYNNIIFSCRAETAEGHKGIHDWCVKYGLMPFIDGITNIKPHADAYVDDRGVHADGNWFGILQQIDALTARNQRKKDVPQ
jgi:hypothetical protein